MKNKAKGVVLDIETYAIKGYTWGLWQQNIALNQIIQTGGLLSIAWQWVGSKKVEFASIWTHSPGELAAILYEVLNEAEYVVGWNSDKFDIRHIQAFLLQEGFPLPSPFRKVDLMRRVQKHAYLPSYKLQYVAQWLGLGGKVDTGGFDLWRAVEAGDEKAQAKMRKYNIGDVRLTTKVFNALFEKGWLHGMLPNAAIAHEGIICPDCGSTHCQSRGVSRTRSREYQRYQCQDCFGWFRATRSKIGTNLVSEAR